MKHGQREAGKSHKKRRKKKKEWSKILSGCVVLAGFIIAQECFLLMYLCLRWDYNSTAAWLTAAIGLAEAIIGLGLQAYIGLAKTDHKEGGITFESAKAKNFQGDESDVESPQI